MSARSKADWRTWAADLANPDQGAATLVAEGVGAWLTGRHGPIACYDAIDGEVDIEIAWGVVDTLVLPRTTPEGVAWHVGTSPLEIHRWGFRQPGPDTPHVDPVDLAAVLVPGRAFDRRGYRLGRGGGHYDRLLPQLSPGTPIVGVSVEARIVDELPVEPHDVPMTHLATETGVRAVR